MSGYAETRTTLEGYRRQIEALHAEMRKLQAAIEKTYTERKTLTRDVGGSAGTRAFADAVIQAVEIQTAGMSHESATLKMN